MTLQEWIQLHHVCERGAEFAGRVCIEPGRDFQDVWERMYRGDWLCWLLDSTLCPFQGGPHRECRLIYDRELSGWWRIFNEAREHGGGKVMTLDQYFRRDALSLWTDTKKPPAHMQAAWKLSADLIRARYTELFVMASLKIQAMPFSAKASE